MNYTIRSWTAVLLLLLVLPGGTAKAAGLSSYDPPASRIASMAAQSFGCRFDPITVPLRLLDAAERALCSNPRSRSAWADVIAQSAQIGVARSTFFPTVNLSGENQWIHDVTDAESPIPIFNSNLHDRYPDVSADLNLVLFDFGLRRDKLRSAKEQLLANLAAADDTFQSILLDTAQDYFEALDARAELDADEENEVAEHANLDVATSKFDQGLAVVTDVLQARTAYSQAVVKRMNAAEDLQKKTGILAVAIGLPVATPLVVSREEADLLDSSFISSINTMLAEALLRSPKVVSARATLRAAEADEAAARVDGLMTISVGVTYRQSKIDYARATIFGAGLIPANNMDRRKAFWLSVSIPLFQGFSRLYSVRAAEADVEGKKAALEDTEQQVELSVWSAYQSLRATTESLTATEGLLRSASAAATATRARYGEGVGNILDVLNAQAALAQARTERVHAISAWHMAKVELAAAIGVARLGGAT